MSELYAMMPPFADGSSEPRRARHIAAENTPLREKNSRMPAGFTEMHIVASAAEKLSPSFATRGHAARICARVLPHFQFTVYRPMGTLEVDLQWIEAPPTVIVQKSRAF